MRRSVILLAMPTGVSAQNIFNLKTSMHTRIGGTVEDDGSNVAAATADDRALLARVKNLLANHDPKQANQESRAEDPSKYEPSLRRQWVRAPPSVLSTTASRRDWFRIMSYNFMVDTVTPFPLVNPDGSTSQEFATTTPVLDVDVPPSLATSSCNPNKVPGFLDFPYRRSYLVNEVRYYDPDVLCLNEVNRTHFNDGLWKYLRSQGYGGLFTSSRGYRIKALRKGDVPSVIRHKGKIQEGEDIGNAIFFHKARFVPHLMPGGELPNHLHYVQFCSLRDKVSNMTVVIANVQLTLGDSDEAKCIRAHEARMVLKVLASIQKYNVDRSHSTTIVCGDLNCAYEEEECVEVLRGKFFSAYDLVGGPRWTTWCRGKNGVKPNSYFEDNKRGWLESDTNHIQLNQQLEAMKRRETDRTLARVMKGRGTASAGGSGGVASPSNTATRKSIQADDSAMTTPRKIIKRFEERVVNERYPWLSEMRTVEREMEVPPEVIAAVAQQDEIAMQKEIMLRQGIIKRTQDFAFYDPNTLALHQVLDAPEDSELADSQMLPCWKHPSHHIPLIADFSFNDIVPDVGNISTKP